MSEWDANVLAAPSVLRALAAEIRAGRSVDQIVVVVSSSPVRASIDAGSLRIEGSAANLETLASLCEDVAAAGEAKAADPDSSPVARHVHLEPIPGEPDTWLASDSFPLQITADA